MRLFSSFQFIYLFFFYLAFSINSQSLFPFSRKKNPTKPTNQKKKRKLSKLETTQKLQNFKQIKLFHATSYKTLNNLNFSISLFFQNSRDYHQTNKQFSECFLIYSFVYLLFYFFSFHFLLLFSTPTETRINKQNRHLK